MNVYIYRRTASGRGGSEEGGGWRSFLGVELNLVDGPAWRARLLHLNRNVQALVHGSV